MPLSTGLIHPINLTPPTTTPQDLSARQVEDMIDTWSIELAAHNFPIEELDAVKSGLMRCMEMDMDRPISLIIGDPEEDHNDAESNDSIRVSLPDVFAAHSSLRSIKSIQIAGLKWLTDLPQSMNQFSGLHLFIVKNCGLKELPAALISNNQNSLEVFDVSGNNLSSLPPEIGRAQNLRICDFRENQIEDDGVPPSIFGLFGLTNADLCYEGNPLSKRMLAELRQHNEIRIINQRQSRTERSNHLR